MQVVARGDHASQAGDLGIAFDRVDVPGAVSEGEQRQDQRAGAHVDHDVARPHRLAQRPVVSRQPRRVAEHHLMHQHGALAYATGGHYACSSEASHSVAMSGA